MIRYVVLAMVLPMLGCPLLSDGKSSRDGGVAPDYTGGGDGAQAGSGGSTPGEPADAGEAGDGTLPGVSGEGSATASDGAVPAEDQAAAVAALVAQSGWGIDVDAGVSSDDDSTSLPPPGPDDGPLALAGLAGTGRWRAGCGEPPLCFLRMAIMTAADRLYTARLGATYPADSCARDVIDGGKNVLIGDPSGRFGDLRCSTSSPQITVGFLIPDQVIGTTIERRWLAEDGFRSQWTIADGAPADNGLYVPEPSKTSTLDLLWLGRFSKGEAYGSLVVPLRNMTTGAPALGELVFAVRIR